MTRVQHTARKERGELRKEKRRHAEKTVEQDHKEQETKTTRKRRKGTSTESKPTSTMENLSMRIEIAAYPTYSGLRAAGKGLTRFKVIRTPGVMRCAGQLRLAGCLLVFIVICTLSELSDSVVPGSYA